MNLIDYLDHGAERSPNGICLTDGGLTLSYSEVQTGSHQIALALQAEGIGEGAKVAVYSINHVMGFLAMLGIFRAGAAWVPVNARSALEETIYILQNSGVEWLFYHSRFEDVIPQILTQAPAIKGAVCVDKAGERSAQLAGWYADYKGEAALLPDDPQRLTMLASTGGTTGRPKGVCLTNRCLETMVSCYLANMPFAQRPVHLVVAPMTHAAGVTIFPLLAQGGIQVFMADVDVENIMRMIERHRVTHLFLPPTLIYEMLAHPRVGDYDYSSLAYFIYAAAPMSADKLKRAIEVFGPVMVQCFGQAEAPMICTFMSKQDHLDALQPGNEQRLLSCGRPSPFVRLAIMDKQGKLLPAGERGEIVVRGGLVMAGYYQNPEATAEVSVQGWHLTGDIGYRDKQGYLYIVDRKKEMIISGGFNVFPAEVEQVIWSHPAVQDCAVIGVPDEKWGEAVTAVVEAVPGKTVDPEEIIALCKAKLGSVKAPKTVEIWESLPRSPVGKVLKKVIREPFWRDRERSI